MDEGYLAKLIMNKIIKDPGVKSIDNTMGEDILSLVRNHETKLELVTKCSKCKGTGNEYGNEDNGCPIVTPNGCIICHGTGEIIRPMTVAKVLEWARYVAEWGTNLDTEMGDMWDFKGGRVRVRKTP